MGKRVIMYTTSWCPDCRAAKRYLDKRGVEYQEIDVEKTPGMAEKLIEWSGGFRTVPVFDIDGEIVVDFDRHRLDRLLSYASGDTARRASSVMGDERGMG